VPGVVVARINMAPQFMRELLDAMSDAWSRYTTTQGIKNLPEADPRGE
jgi:riboflavin synthase